MTTELTNAAQQALMALRRAVPKDSEQAHEQLLAVQALNTALTQRPAAQTEREAFEAWVTKQGVALQYEGDGHYGNATVSRWWQAWQACASLPAPQQATPEPVLFNGLTESETNATASVMGLTATPPQQAAGEPVAVFDESKGRPVLLPSAPLLKHGDKLYTHPAPVVPEGWEQVGFTVSGDVTNWARDFSMYRTQHYTRPVFAAAQAKGGEHD